MQWKHGNVDRVSDNFHPPKQTHEPPVPTMATHVSWIDKRAWCAKTALVRYAQCAIVSKVRLSRHTPPYQVCRLVMRLAQPRQQRRKQSRHHLDGVAARVGPQQRARHEIARALGGAQQQLRVVRLLVAKHKETRSGNDGTNGNANMTK